MIRTAEALAQATDEAERKSLAARYDRLNELLRHHDAFNVDHRIEQVLDGLGFGREDYHRPVDTFSGGQQSRLMLAKLLLAAPDVMLLDEPSNHLDIDTTRWLEDYLVKQPEAMLIVSHDRYFLDRVVTKVFELHADRITSYPGNFQQYWRLRQERYEQELKAYESQKEYIEKQEEYIRRVHYGQLHKQAASRQKQIDKIERLERPTLVESPQMHFGEVRRSRRRGAAGRGPEQGLRPAAVQGPEFQPAARPAAGHHGPQRQRQDDAAARPAGRGGAGRRQGAARPPGRFGYYDQHLKTLDPRQAGDPGGLAGGRPRRGGAGDARPAGPLRPDGRSGVSAGRRAVAAARRAGRRWRGWWRRASTCWCWTSRRTTSTCGRATRWSRRCWSSRAR